MPDRPENLTHTPGPWLVEEYGISGPDWHVVVRPCDGHRYSEITSDPASLEIVNPADAHLIAAAPMLFEGAVDTLAALRLLREGLAVQAPETIEVLDAHIAELEHAIAIARGEQ